MGPITAKVEIDLPRSEVFAEIADLARRPRFTEPYQTDFRLMRLESAGVGAAARFHSSAGGGWMSTEIVEAQAPHRLLERGHCGRANRVPTTTAWALVELPSGLTAVEVTFFTDPSSVFDRLTEMRQGAERRHRRGWRESLDRLREQLESGSEAERAAVGVAGQGRLSLLSTGTLASI